MHEAGGVRCRHAGLLLLVAAGLFRLLLLLVGGRPQPAPAAGRPPPAARWPRTLLLLLAGLLLLLVAALSLLLAGLFSVRRFLPPHGCNSAPLLAANASEGAIHFSEAAGLHHGLRLHGAGLCAPPGAVQAVSCNGDTNGSAGLKSTQGPPLSHASLLKNSAILATL
jgi:hypothetical protein